MLFFEHFESGKERRHLFVSNFEERGLRSEREIQSKSLIDKNAANCFAPLKCVWGERERERERQTDRQKERQKERQSKWNRVWDIDVKEEEKDSELDSERSVNRITVREVKERKKDNQLDWEAVDIVCGAESVCYRGVQTYGGYIPTMGLLKATT